MLNPLDDYPVHQTPQPLAHPVTGDRNFYDRYFYNGHLPDGSLFFGAALGVYPNRSVIDASFSVLVDGVQTSVHASARMPADRTVTRCGPVGVEVLEPLARHRLTVEAPEVGIRADLVFSAVARAVEEPRFTRLSGVRTTMDYTRLTQFGSWSGSVEVDGRRHDCSRDVHGCRDRSWGVRPVGEREAGAPSRELPQFFWLWAPLWFGDVGVHADAQEEADGTRWHDNAVIVPAGDPTSLEPLRRLPFDHEVTWRPGTRRARAARLRVGDEVIDLEPLADFQMLGLGYLHPEWSHGVWKGEEASGHERWVVSELDPLAPQHLHVQQVVRARWGDRTGTGVLEQLVIGPHAPSGFEGLFDGAAGL